MRNKVSELYKSIGGMQNKAAYDKLKRMGAIGVENAVSKTRIKQEFSKQEWAGLTRLVRGKHVKTIEKNSETYYYIQKPINWPP